MAWPVHAPRLVRTSMPLRAANPQTLLDAIKFDHGYTSTSPVVLCFLEVLTELDLLDQRRFLRFVTGAWAGGMQGAG